MNLLLSMLPFYLFGNLHCLGMCGPLVMMIGSHRYRAFYFIGRTSSFTLAATLAGEVGAVLNVFFNQYHLPAAASFLFGSLILLIGICTLCGRSYPGHDWLGKKMASTNRTLSMLMLKDQPLATFLFGFFTVLLPCGQTLVVFSACALAGSAWIGALNGFAFALLTSPALLFAMKTHSLMSRAKAYYNTLMGSAAILVGGLAICRAFAEIEVIPHIGLHLPYVHLSLF